MKKTGKGSIDSPMTHFGPKPSVEGQAGVYDRHPNLGPAGVSGGVPLKFVDESIKTPKGRLPNASMNAEPAKVSES